MIYKGLFLAGALLAFGGCGHLRTASSVSATNVEPAATDTADKHPVGDALIDADTRSEADLYAETAELTAPIMTAKQDLFSRIRTGFRFPELDSKHIKEHEKWSSQHPTYLNNLFARAEPFLFYIVEQIEKRGLPTEIALLPAIESAYKPDAVSRSKAGGLWQFIPSTGKYYGLHQDWWYDGRRDAIAATNAALDYLVNLNALFDGDWFLTLAAYNAGPGTVLKAIKKNTQNHRGLAYQDLKLSAETARYIPKLLALKNIIADPAKYGVALPTIDNRPHFGVVNLSRQIDLHAFAEQAAIDLPILQHLNAGYRRWATGPHGPQRLLVPLSDMARANLVLENLKTQAIVQFRDHQIVKGDTLSAIGRRYGVTVSALKTTNRLSGTSIRAGRSLMVPISDRNASQKLTIAAVKSRQAQDIAGSNADGQLVHRVIAGETLWSIARRYQVKVAQLLSWNELAANQILDLDQALTVFIN